MSNNPTKAASLLTRDPHLSHLARMLHQQQTLLKEVRSLLPEQLARHCLHARISGTRLVLHVDSPAWSSKLRFHSRSLLQSLRSRAPNLRKVSIRLLFPEAGQKASHHGGKPPGHPSLVDAISDPELRRLLNRQRD